MPLIKMLPAVLQRTNCFSEVALHRITSHALRFLNQHGPRHELHHRPGEENRALCPLGWGRSRFVLQLVLV
jgi:hypothetical protein